MSTRTFRVSGAAALVVATATIGVATTPAVASAQFVVQPPEVTVDHASGTTTSTVTVRNPNPAGWVPFTFCQAYVVPAGAWNGGSGSVLELIGHTLRYPTALVTLAPVSGGEQATYTVDTLAAEGWDVVGLCDDVYLPEMNAATEVVGEQEVTGRLG
ncbi:hypothetical protein [Rhodococcus gannanensis]|uniref:Uncharacterized protein n=1 Tax=Rhodococcus gannanensis TaxID=1960308 RepID=A0ABW4NWR1_9NOCA